MYHMARHEKQIRPKRYDKILSVYGPRQVDSRTFYVLVIILEKSVYSLFNHLTQVLARQAHI